ncbi:dipeptidyl peptidase III [Aspergillus fijiensis CBS 313.89]|uniref:Dipeptidyl peptidase 3 n=1 Tax=Aspergillus fijiensis CBS 313.89 TaxID=1448319 RepID=A0A8G1RZ75_9EURO|nr:dipeptidyl peptidase III [Aspergillus fijiensis CBS 313.89]RAK81447.1 dipeptidyl peptidase III [Aspergillus fijiensis CBS 313.89]
MSATPQVFQLSVASAFQRLSPQQKLYAHYMAKPAWSGTRIILRQVSPEANGIFDLIVGLYQSCDGDWDALGRRSHVADGDLELFLDYAANFLSNMGNYYGSGDQKFVPAIPAAELARVVAAAGASSVAGLWESVRGAMYQAPPVTLGPPGPLTQSAYYPGCEPESFEADAASAASVMEDQAILPENTRLYKQRASSGEASLDILRASLQDSEPVCLVERDPVESGATIRLVGGDHKHELARIVHFLDQALVHVANPLQAKMIRQLQDSFRTGNLDAYKDAQRTWVEDRAPSVETVLGFVEPYRDPLGVRAEFEGIVGIADAGETQRLRQLAQLGARIIRRLPWVPGVAADNGPFEKEVFEAPDFSSVHSLAYASSIVFPGINLPNYNDIRQESGYKNIIFSNRMVAESQRARGIHMVAEAERDTFRTHRFHAYYVWVVLHEIFGHGSGRFLMETVPGRFNFDPKNPPSHPVTGVPIATWYRPGQTWTGVFGSLSTTLDECRAELVGAYLIDDEDILAVFGYTPSAPIQPEDVVYNLYLQLGIDGLRGLENYDPDTKKWGQAHSRAHYAIFRHLLRDTPALYTIACDPERKSLTITLDRPRVLQEGKPSLGRMLLNLHIFRCTADSTGCKAYYEDLTRVDEEALQWRAIVLARRDPPLTFAQANTFLEGEMVTLREYDATARGVVRSWAEREVH